MVKLNNNWFLPVKAEFFLRRQGMGKAMLLIVLDEEAVPDNIPEVGCFGMANLILDIIAAFNPGENTFGYTANQILCHSWSTEEMESIELC